MKKTYHYYGLIALAAMTIAPMVIFAEDNISSTSPKAKLRAVVHNVEQKVEKKVETKLQNVKANQDIRNNTIGARDDIKNASMTKEKHEIRAEMRKDIFKVELNKIVRQLNISLNNLKQIRARVEARIEKSAQTGRDMSKAKVLLVTADAKITLAEQAINSLKSLATSTPVLSTTATSTIKLEKPRQAGATAIKAVNDARKALNDVVVAIAHGMGLKLGTATTTATTSATE